MYTLPATGYYRNKECPNCKGAGYLFMGPQQRLKRATFKRIGAPTHWISPSKSPSGPWRTMACCGAHPPALMVRSPDKSGLPDFFWVIGATSTLLATKVKSLCCGGDFGKRTGYFHSYRSETIGSTRFARRAGNHEASSAASVSNIAIPASVSGSVALTPYNNSSAAKTRPSSGWASNTSNHCQVTRDPRS